MKIVFISKAEAERLIPLSGQAMISICEPGEYANVSFSCLLRLYFHDADKQQSIEQQNMGYEKYEMFCEIHAEKIISFYESLTNDIDTLIVHCHAGISRSAAVAKALCDRYNIENNYKNYTLHNKLVYNTILNYGVEKYV